MLDQTPMNPPSRGDWDYVHHTGRDEDEDDEGVDACSMHSVPSVLSYDSQRDGHVHLRDVAGRVFNSLNPLYFLPAGM
jgi:hypothetical protein